MCSKYYQPVKGHNQILVSIVLTPLCMCCGYDEVSAAVREHRPLVVDVRRVDEFAAGHIPGAANIPLHHIEEAFGLSEERFLAQYGVQKPGRGETFLPYCKLGIRATKARDKLHRLGYSRVTAYSGSFTEWVQMGREVEK